MRLLVGLISCGFVPGLNPVGAAGPASRRGLGAAAMRLAQSPVRRDRIVMKLSQRYGMIYSKVLERGRTILALTLMGKRQPIVSDAGLVRSPSQRGFARGLVFAVPLALLLWALIVWQF
jgi:hypothetical protein